MLKNFRLNILARIIIIAILLGTLVYNVIVSGNYLRSTYFSIFLIAALAEMFWYIDKTNRNLAAFFQALNQNDFTTNFPETAQGKSFKELHISLNAITQKFKSMSTAKQAQHIYLESLVEHIRVGIISFDSKEKIHLINGAFKKMIGRTQLPYLKHLASVDEYLLEAIREIKPNQTQLIKLKTDHELLQLSLHASAFKIQDTHYKLVSFQNIKNELDANEMDAWQKLIRVLTHEIMNSVTPISSLSSTLHDILASQSQADTIQPDLLPKIMTGLEAIKVRSGGLQAFTETYRNLTRIPTPDFRKVDLNQLIDRIIILLNPELKHVALNLHYHQPHTYIMADSDLLDQVLINIIKNALEALSGSSQPALNISVQQAEDVTITIADNGPGIDKDKIDQIFIPFFTTKKGGSGIGLALSKQIIRLHNGTLHVESELGQGTQFTIKM